MSLLVSILANHGLSMLCLSVFLFGDHVVHTWSQSVISIFLAFQDFPHVIILSKLLKGYTWKNGFTLFITTIPSRPLIVLSVSALL